MITRLSKISIFILTIILGISIAIQIKYMDFKFEYIPLKTIYDYKKSIEREKTEVMNLQKLIKEYDNKIQEYNLASNKDEDITKILQDEIKEYKTISGYTDLNGAGIILIMSDGTRELYEGEDANNIIVHDIDVLNIINDLKVAGAEAISINGERVINGTEIYCDGPTITINNKTYGQPFIIKAIGEPKQLESAIKAPGTYGNLLKGIGLFIEAYTSVNIEIPAFTEDVFYEYLKVKEGD